MLFPAFALVFAVAHVTAEIPSFIHICGRKDPNLDKCVEQSVLSIKDRVCQGIPELDVQSSEPLVLETISISDASNAKISLENTQIIGLCDYRINSVHMDLDKNHFDVDLIFNRIRINTTYELNLQILVPLDIKGLLFIVVENVGAKAGLDMKLVTKDGNKYVYMSKMTLSLDIKGYEAEYDSNVQDKVMHEAIDNFLGTNQQEIIETLSPMIEQAVSRETLRISNDIVKHFTYDELFPDRE